jgi:cytochrome b pre-mRNA-processing protein 3
MLRFLFRGLTVDQSPGRKGFDRLVSEARGPHWYLKGAVPDTINGRFAVLATVCALAIVRVEKGKTAELGSMALTERFIEAMDSEHREMGLNDPGLGRRVRKLVGSLARRVDQWSAAVAGERDWNETTRDSLGIDGEADPKALDHCAVSLRALWSRLCAVSGEDVIEGRF